MAKRDGRLIIHIGAGKCGSSALQSALSMTPCIQDRNGAQFRYAAWAKRGRNSGRLVSDRALTRAAQLSRYGYASAPSASNPDELLAFLAALSKDHSKTDHNFIASHESWVQNLGILSNALAETKQVEAVAFVRPPIPWLNSAYWQWAHWAGTTFPRWVSKQGFWNMGPHLEDWSNHFGSRLTVRPAGHDIVSTFYDILDVDQTAPPSNSFQASNTSSPRVLLRVLFRNKHLRSSAHDGSIEFVLARWCDFSGLSKPWAVSPVALKRLHLQYEPLVKRFFDTFPDCAELAKDDPNWLSPVETLMERCEASLDDGKSTHIEELQLLGQRLQAGILRLGQALHDSRLADQLGEVAPQTEDRLDLEKRAVHLIEKLSQLDREHRIRSVLRTKWLSAFRRWLPIQ